MNEDFSPKNNEINEQLKQLVIARIESQISPNLKLSIGGGKSLSKDEMIKHVMEGDEIGNQIIEVHLNFIKAQATGQLGSALSSV
ncbi:hypothetical protein K9L16_01515 [Candidatus Pacearchaeota archaeon]|nr:hypothetical protein [Candidatus Pacearchaeota archaeon]